MVTELGGSAPVAETVVDAANWMAAFKAARGRIGEPESIPIGGSCSVAPDGRVNVLDPQTRRAYTLHPLGDAQATPPDPAATPAVPERKPRPKTMAYLPDAMVPNVAPPVPPSTPVSKKTMAYTRGELGLPPLPPREDAVGRPAADAPPVAPIPAAAAPVPAPPPPTRVVDERHVPPGAESPVHYHERLVETHAGQSPQSLEAIVREHVDLVRATIEGELAVHFVRVLAFATERDASSEPLAVCVWKGWTDEVSVQFPAAEPSIARALSAPSSLYQAAEGDPRLAEVVEAFEDVGFLASPASGLEFTTRVLEDLFPDTLVLAAVRDSSTSLDFHVASARGGQPSLVLDHLANEGLLALAASDPARAVAVVDSSRDARTRPRSDGEGGGPLLAVAAAHEGAILGVVRLTRTAGRATFTAADADVVRCAAARLGAFLRSRGTHLD